MDISPADVEAAIADRFTRALQRARADYLEMPGLQLTEAQAARLWSVDTDLERLSILRSTGRL